MEINNLNTLKQLSMKHHLYSKKLAALIAVFLMVSWISFGQDRKVSGTVLDDKGQGIPGASVLLKGTTTGTTSDVNGSFSINVKNNSSELQVSSVGYLTKSVAVGSQASVKVILAEDVSQLNEVVVTGYTAQRKKDITGAVAVVGSKELTALPAASVTQMLQGRASGVTVGNDNSPGGGTMVRVRGFGSINNNSPLYIIDGVPTQGTLNQINPNDIESMQVLKDASAASIYGARAANGVVIITTKRGGEGEPKINFDMYTGTQTVGKTLDLLNTQELGRFYYESEIGAGKPAGTSPSAQYRFDPSGNQTIADYIYPNVYGDLPANYTYTNDIADPALGKTAFNITKANKQGTDWQHEIFGPAKISNYQIGATGGSKYGKYAISGSYFNQDGILKYTSYKRYSVRANTEFTRGNLTFGENFTVSYDERVGVPSGNNNESNPITFAIRVQPIIPVFDITGGPRGLGGTNTSDLNGFAGSRGSNLGNAPNPLARQWREKDNITYGTHMFGNVFLEYKILKDLKFRTSLGFEYNNSNFSQYLNRDIEAAEPRSANSLTVYNNYDRAITWYNTLTYNKTIGDHTIGVLAGTEAVSTYSFGFNAARSNFAFDDMTYRYLNMGSAAGLSNAGSGALITALYSQFAKANYSYKDIFLADFTIRRDGSSRFSPAYRYGVFPAFSLGVRLTELSFMKDLTFLNDLKVRGGWGKTGNQLIPNVYNAYTLFVPDPNNNAYDISGSGSSIAPGFDISQFGNTSGRWETNTSTNIGFDASMLNNRLDVNFDWYTRTTSDMLTQVPIPKTGGTASIPYVNIGEVNNTGIDLNVTWRDKIGDFRYSVSGQYSQYKNNVVKLNDDPKASIFGYSTRLPAISVTKAGLPISSFYGYVIDGLFDTQAEVDSWAKFGSYNKIGRFKFRDVNGDGVITAADKTIIGNPHPDFTYGLNLSLGYKNWDLAVFVQGVQGNEIFNYSKFWTDFNTFQGNRSKDMLYRSWRAPGDGSILPRLDSNDGTSQQISSYFVEDGSYTRIKNVQLTYNFPKSILNRLKLSSVQVYVQGQNLFTFTKYKGLDPEINLRNAGGDNTDIHMGIDEGAFPTAKSYNVGLRVGF